MVQDAPSPRIIKTHLPFEVLPTNLLDKAYVFYVARNPLDQFLSACNMQLRPGFGGNKCKGTVADVAELCLAGQSLWGSYWAHLKVNWSFVT